MIAFGVTLLTVSVIACTNTAQDSSIPPAATAVTGTATNSGGSGGGGGGGSTTGGVNDPLAAVLTAPVIPAPVPSPTNNSVANTDPGIVLATSSWIVKYTLNGVQPTQNTTSFQDAPFQFDGGGYYNSWHKVSVNPRRGRMPVGFWYSTAANPEFGIKSSITFFFCGIDKAFQPLAGTWELNAASTENHVILDKMGADAHMEFSR